MQFAQVADFIAAFGQDEALALTRLDEPEAEEIKAELINRALVLASDEAASFVTAAGYQLPLVVLPGILTQKTLDIARYRLEHINARDDVRKRYEDALTWLMMLAKGTVNLGIPKGLDADADAVEGMADPVYYSAGRSMGERRLDSYSRMRPRKWY